MKKFLVAVAGLCMATNAAALEKRPFLDLESAEKIRDGCLAYARDHDVDVAVSVFDQSGNLVVFARMDGASVGMVEVAMWKGKSASLYLLPTALTGTWDSATAPHIATVPGGVPIYAKGDIGVGGVGVSGGSFEDDVGCAEAGIKAAKLSPARSE